MSKKVRRWSIWINFEIVINELQHEHESFEGSITDMLLVRRFPTVSIYVHIMCRVPRKIQDTELQGQGFSPRRRTPGNRKKVSDSTRIRNNNFFEKRNCQKIYELQNYFSY